MHINKKAQTQHVWKWFIYIPMTLIVVFIVVYIPSVILDNAVKTQNLENIVLADRVYNKMSIYDWLLFRLYPGHTCKGGCFDQRFINDSFDNTGSSKEVGFKLVFNKKPIYFNKDFYDDAVVLVPVRYDRFIEERPVIIVDTGKIDKLTIDQVYSGRLRDFEN
ncbi:hypothetical protein JW851_01705 [Candidatus Woesearchaeota archaeon]|nr:hypothetical protein [Candidatus Woesearchaeota archaeon]